MTISSCDLYVIACYISYSGISGDTDRLYTDKAEAEKAAEEVSVSKYGVSLKYTAMTLSDYISEVRSEAYQDGARSERDSY